MNRAKPKKSSIGGRTGENVLANKVIRKLADGKDNFCDYFSDTSDDSTATSGSQSPVFHSQSYGVVTRNSKALGKEGSQGVTYSSPVKSKPPRTVIGIRSQKNILPLKSIRKQGNGTDNFNDYFTDSGSLESTSRSALPENSSSLHSLRVSSKGKNSSIKAPEVLHSSAITRLSSSKAIINDADNSIGSESQDLREEFQRSESQQSHHGDLLDNDLNDTIKVVDPQCLSFSSEENLNDHDLQLLEKEKVDSNPSKTPKSLKKIAVKSPKKKVSFKEERHLTIPDIETSFDTQSVNKNKLERAIGKILKIKQNTSISNKIRRNESEHSQLDENIDQDSEELSEENDIAEKESTSYGSKDVGRKSPLKRNSSFTPVTASKKKNLFLTSAERHMPTDTSVHSHFDMNNAQNSEEPSEENDVAEKESTSYRNKDVNMKSPLKRKSSCTPVAASKKKDSFVISAKKQMPTYKSVHSHLDVNDAQYSEENDVAEKKSTSYGNKDVARKSSLLAVAGSKKKANSFEASAKKPTPADKSVHSHFAVNTAQDFEKSPEENDVTKGNTSCRNKDVRKSSVKRKSNLTPATVSKKKANLYVASARKHMPADEREKKRFSSLNLSDKNLNKTSKNVQHLDSSPRRVLNATFQIQNPELSLPSTEKTSRKTIKSKACSQDTAESEKNKQNEQTGKEKKRNRPHKNNASAPCRKSSRKTIRPLEAWRNERPRYRFEDGVLHFVDIEPGNQEDDGSKKAIAARMEKQRKKKEECRKKIVNPQKVKFIDLVLKREVTLPLLKKFSIIPWQGEHNAPFCVKKVVQTSHSNFGFIEIKAGESKPMQYLPNEDIYLCPMQGKLKAVIGEREIIVEEKDTLVVPRYVPYTLINEGRKKALLIFSVGKYKYLESELCK